LQDNILEQDTNSVEILKYLEQSTTPIYFSLFPQIL
jgi:hypothetical protein